MENLTAQDMSRLNSAFKPSTQADYTSMFRVFMAFCVYMKVAMVDVHVGLVDLSGVFTCQQSVCQHGM